MTKMTNLNCYWNLNSDYYLNLNYYWNLNCSTNLKMKMNSLLSNKVLYHQHQKTVLHKNLNSNLKTNSTMTNCSMNLMKTSWMMNLTTNWMNYCYCLSLMNLMKKDLTKNYYCLNLMNLITTKTNSRNCSNLNCSLKMSLMKKN